MSRSLRNSLAVVSLAALAALLWAFVLPPHLGGRTTYLTTRGISMEPYLHTGDLVMLQEQGSYKVGDVIAYHSETINATVLHRIVSIDGAGITTKGDNNTWLDLDHPTNHEITGKLVHKFVGAGKQVRYLRAWPVQLVGLGLIGWAVWNAFAVDSTKDRRRLLRRVPPAKPSLDPATDLGGHRALLRRFRRGSLPVVAAVVLGTSSVVAMVGFSNAAGQRGTPQVIYTLHGDFGYSARAHQAGAVVYPDDQVSTSDPIYLSLVDDLFVSYNLRWDSIVRFKGSGSTTLDATIKGKSGWSHTIDLGPATSYTGADGRATAVVNLSAIRDIASQVQRLTHVTEPSYTVDITAKTHLDGTVSGQRTSTDFTSVVELTGDATILRVASSTAPAIAPNVKSDVTKNADSQTHTGLSTSQSTTLDIPASAPARVAAFGMSVGVMTLRIVGVAGILVALALAASMVLARRRTRLQERSIESEVARYRKLLVPVSGGTTTNRVVVEIPDLASLVRIADSYGALVLHERTNDRDVFVVNHDATTYRCTAVRADADRFGADLPAPGEPVVDVEPAS